MLDKQIIKFIVTGSVNTVVYYLLFSFFIYIQLDYKIAVLFATIIGVLFSFKTFGKYVFNNKNNKLIYKFFIVYAVIYILNILFIYLFNLYVNDYYSSGLFSTLICAIISFVLNKNYVFKDSDE